MELLNAVDLPNGFEYLNVQNNIGWTTFRRKMKHFPKLKENVTYEKDANGHWLHILPITISIEDAVECLLPLSKELAG
jgi:hypothetical protein